MLDTETHSDVRHSVAGPAGSLSSASSRMAGISALPRSDLPAPVNFARERLFSTGNSVERRRANYFTGSRVNALAETSVGRLIGVMGNALL